MYLSAGKCFALHTTRYNLEAVHKCHHVSGADKVTYVHWACRSTACHRMWQLSVFPPHPPSHHQVPFDLDSPPQGIPIVINIHLALGPSLLTAAQDPSSPVVRGREQSPRRWVICFFAVSFNASMVLHCHICTGQYKHFCIAHICTSPYFGTIYKRSKVQFTSSIYQSGSQSNKP